MTLISVTRLRVRSYAYLPQFLWYAVRAARQAECAPGFAGGRLLREAKNVFWTMTAWDDAAAMSAYRIHGPHRQAMPKLLLWCDEASVVHWEQEDAGQVSWPEAHHWMVKEGRPSKVNFPSAAQKSGSLPAPQPGRIERTLKPFHAGH